MLRAPTIIRGIEWRPLNAAATAASPSFAPAPGPDRQGGGFRKQAIDLFQCTDWVNHITQLILLMRGGAP